MAIAGEPELIGITHHACSETPQPLVPRRVGTNRPWTAFAVMLLLVTITGARLAAQSSADSLPRIAAITLTSYSVYDPGDSSLQAHVGNFLHVTTRAAFIRREFLFHVGDVYDSALVAETARNLRAAGAFRDVSIDTTHSDSGVVVHVITRDALTFQPVFALRLGGGSFGGGLTLVEDNLFGTLTQVVAGFTHDPDRNTFLLGFLQRRLIANRIGAALQLADRSDGKLFFGQIAQPYFEEDSRMSDAITVDDRRDRILQFRDGVQTARDTLENRYVLGRVDYGRAVRHSVHGYVRINLAAQARRDDYVPQASYDAAGFPHASNTGAIGVYAEASHVDKPAVFAFESLSRTEDVDLSPTIRLSLFVAPTAFGYDSLHAGLAPAIAVHLGTLIPHGFIYGDVSASGLFARHGLDSGQVYTGVTAVYQPARRHQFLAHGEVSALRNPLPGTEFDLGFDAGPRAFGAHAFTGDREFFGTVEYRYTLGLDVLKVADVGLAAFADEGGAWWATEPQRYGWDVGVGLRLNFNRGAEVTTNRIDLAYRGPHDGLPGGWAIAVAKGLSFSTTLRGTAR